MEREDWRHSSLRSWPGLFGPVSSATQQLSFLCRLRRLSDGAGPPHEPLHGWSFRPCGGASSVQEEDEGRTTGHAFTGVDAHSAPVRRRRVLYIYIYTQNLILKFNIFK